MKRATEMPTQKPKEVDYRADWTVDSAGKNTAFMMDMVGSPRGWCRVCVMGWEEAGHAGKHKKWSPREAERANGVRSLDQAYLAAWRNGSVWNTVQVF